MAHLRGKGNAYLKIGANKLTGTKGDLNLPSFSRDTIETTDDDDIGHKSFLPGDSEQEVSGSYNYEDEASSPLAQEAIADNANDNTGALLTIEWAKETGVGKKKWAASAFVTSWNPVNGDPTSESFTLKIAGAVTESVQS